MSEYMSWARMGVASRKPGVGSSWKRSTLLFLDYHIVKKKPQELAFISQKSDKIEFCLG